MNDDSNNQPGHREVSIAIENPFLHIRVRGLLLWYLFGSIPVGFVLSIFAVIWQISAPTMGIIAHILLDLGLYYWIYRKSKKQGNIDLLQTDWIYQKSKQENIDIRLFFPRVSSKWLHLSGLTLCLVLFSAASTNLIIEFLSYVWPSLPEVVESRLYDYDPERSVFNRSIYILLVIVLAPITEEILFRGILLSRWSAKWGMRKAVLISALVFSILHANILDAFLFALCMTILYLRTQTLLVPIAVHVLHNMIVIAMEIGAARHVGAYNTIVHFLSMAWVKGACFAITLSIIVTYLYRKWPKKDALSPYILQMKEESRSIEHTPTLDVG